MLESLGRALKRLFGWRYRSSVTGKFVKPDYARKHPDITVRERVDP